MMWRRVNRHTKHILYSNMSGELKSVLEDGPIEGEPLVSVCVITYNHGKYIRQCLDGILMQKVNFPYEILIHDDASPDDTADIIREYWEKYPTVIKPILREENQYSKGVDVSRFNFDRAKAKYIAQCEGDDYWTDDGKLQMQVDFLEEHEEYVECGHNVRCINDLGYLLPKSYIPYTYLRERDYSIDDIKNGKIWRIPTASAVYRNIYPNLDEKTVRDYYVLSANGDFKINILLSNFGKCHVFKRPMSVYRYIVNSGTSYQARNKGKNNILYNYNVLIELEEYHKSIFNVDVNYKFMLSWIVAGAIGNSIIPLLGDYKRNNQIKKDIASKYIQRYGKVSYVTVVIPLIIPVGIRYMCRIAYQKLVDLYMMIKLF